jgi:hypothetical protein
VKGSGNASFDEAVLAMMRPAGPVPAPPPLVADEGSTFTMPIFFQRTESGRERQVGSRTLSSLRLIMALTNYCTTRGR